MATILRAQDEDTDDDERGLARSVLHGLIHDHGFHYAAGTAFRAMLATFPLLIGLVSLLALIGAGDRADDVLEAAGRTDAVPGRTTEALREQLDELDEPGPNLLIGTIAAFALAMWSAAAAFRTMMSGLNRALDIDEHRPLVRRFFVSLGLAAITATFAIIATVLVAEGPLIEEFVEGLPGGDGPFEAVWDLLRFPLIALFVFAWLAVTYAWGPADRQRLKLATPGIVIAFLAWMVFALLFSWYVDSVANQEQVYGGFVGLVVFQLYVYWSALIVLIGAQVDCALANRSS